MYPIIRGYSLRSYIRDTHSPRIKNDCIVLLNYVYRHMNDRQTLSQLSRETGIPRKTLERIIYWGCDVGEAEWILRWVADEYGFKIAYSKTIGRVLDVWK